MGLGDFLVMSAFKLPYATSTRIDPEARGTAKNKGGSESWALPLYQLSSNLLRRADSP